MTVRSSCLPALLVVLLPVTTLAQATHSYAGGTNLAGSAGPSEFYTHGFSVQGAVGVTLAAHWALRVDALVSRFSLHQTVYPPQLAIPCPLHAGCSSGYGMKTPLGIAALDFSLVRMLAPETARFRPYLMAGPGAYWFFEHPSATGRVRAGLASGVGITTALGAHAQLFVEARYHAILNAPSGPSWVAPVNVGVTLPGLLPRL